MVTVIVAVPIATAVTLPDASTVATAGFEDAHVTDGYVASAGATVACSVSVWPTVKADVVLPSVTPVTETAVAITV